MTTLVLGKIYLQVEEKESTKCQSMQDRKISSFGQEFQPRTPQDYPILQTLRMDYILIWLHKQLNPRPAELGYTLPMQTE